MKILQIVNVGESNITRDISGLSEEQRRMSGYIKKLPSGHKSSEEAIKGAEQLGLS